MINFSYSRNPFVALGFSQYADGALRATAGSTVTLTPTDDRFYQLVVTLPGGAMVTAVLAAVALKICQEGVKL